MAEVYRVVDTTTSEVVALKRLRAEIVETRPAVALLFEREYHTLKQLAHPRIIKAFDYGVDEGRPYYTMELLTGEDLVGLAPLPFRQACAVLRDVASSLAIIHSRRLLHRDISPRNVRRDASGRAKLFDFGAMATLGVSGEVIGTPPCIAPEALHGQALDVRADLFGLGALAYWTLTGTHAYPARTISGLRDAWRSRPRPPRQRAADVPRALDELVLSLLSLDPLARPVSAAEVIDRLTVVADLDPSEPLDVARAYLATPTLLGREQELLRFRKQVLRAGRGRGGASIVEAAPGLGRTRLLHALELEGKLSGATVLRADAATSSDRELGVVRALLRDLFATLPEPAQRVAAPFARELSDALPELREPLSASLETTVGDARAEGATELGVEVAACNLLAELTRKHSLVLAIDNAQRADASSLAVLARLANQAPERKLALVLSVERAGQAPTNLALDAVSRRATRVELAPLTEAQTTQLAQSVFGDVPNLARVASWMHRLAQGNPRACMELAQHLLERGIARYEGGAFVLPAKLSEHELPSSFEDTLEQRLRALSQPASDLACGLARSDVPLKLDEYATLIDDGPVAASAVFAAIDELVSAGVLVSHEDAYVFSQGGYAELARSGDSEAQRKRLSLRLARVFERRNDLARQSTHLLHAGQDLAALATMLSFYDTIKEIGFDRAPMVRAALDSLIPSRPTTWSAVEDTTAAVRVREKLLEVCERYARPSRESFVLRTGIMALANFFDGSLMRGHVEHQLRQLAHDSGAIYMDELAGSGQGAAQVKRCMARAQAVYDAAAEHERVLPPSDALGAMVLTIGTAQSYGRQAYDIAVLEQAVVLGDYLRRAVPTLESVYTAALHSLTFARGVADRASELRRGMIAFYDGLLASGREVLSISRIGRALAIQFEGFDRALYASAEAERYAALLCEPIVPQNPGGDHIWQRRAWEVRRLLHLSSGRVGDARECQEQIDRLALHHAFAAYGGGCAFIEAQTLAVCSDLMGLKQSLEAIAAIAERQYPGWRPFLRVATGDYQRLRGELEGALTEYDAAIASTAPGRHAAWAPAATGRIQALIDSGAAERAAELATQALADARAAELGFLAEQDLERVCALALARAGDPATAGARLEATIERALERGLGGVRLGNLYEARARIAIEAADSAGFSGFAERTAELYRVGRGPALAAKYERLVEAARAAQLTVGAELMHAAEIVSAMGLSEGHGFHTQLEGCEDDASRRQRALDLLLERTGAQSGFLYSVGDRGALKLIIARPDRSPPTELQPALDAYVRAELDETGDATVTCFDHAARSFAGALSSYYPVLVSELREGERAIVGIAALECQGELSTPGHDLLSLVSQVLGEPPPPEEVVSMFG